MVCPAMNIHRSAFAGRNFEYYLRRWTVIRKIAANAVVGAEKIRRVCIFETLCPERSGDKPYKYALYMVKMSRQSVRFI